MALRCVLQPNPASQLVSMTIAGNFTPSHQRCGMERCPKEMEKQRLSQQKPSGSDPPGAGSPLGSAAHPQVNHPILCFRLKNGAPLPYLVPTKPLPPPQAKPRAVRRPPEVTPWVPRQKQGIAPGPEPSCHSQDKRLSREKKI